MTRNRLLNSAKGLAAGVLLLLPLNAVAVNAQEKTTATAETAAAPAPQAPEPLSAEEMEILVARIALYPDELVALIASSSLYPLQIVQAQRYLESVKTNPEQKPSSSWDSSVVALLNYPQIVKMMNDDLEWTEALGEAVTYQQKDMLIAIQQLRDEAVAMGVLKTDDKTVVVVENDNVVIKPATAEVIYVPQYEPEMLYVPEYVPVPVVYYPDPYPNYYYPTAPYFAAFTTGLVWGAVIDWDDWGVWGGSWDDDVNIDIDCNNCFNDVDYNGTININDVDWTNVDPTKIKIDQSQFNNINTSTYKANIKADSSNNISVKAADVQKYRPAPQPVSTAGVSDVRKSTLEGLQTKPAKPPGTVGKPAPAPTKTASPATMKPPASIDRPVGKPKPAATPDTRTTKPVPIGDVSGGKDTKVRSSRGGKAMGGGINPSSTSPGKKKRTPR